MKLETVAFVEHRSVSVQPALAAFGQSASVGMVVPGGCCSCAGCSSCSCGATAGPRDRVA